MDLRGVALVPAIALLASSCGPRSDSPSAEGAWVGTVTLEGNVTTVVNESGSVWGGTATLVEEASIGVATGADEFMFGFVAGVAATDDRIFVLDSQLPALRVYDHDGNHLYDIGAHGQGPGEFQAPSSVALASDGRVFLRDENALQILIYSDAGEHLGRYEMTSGLHTTRPMTVSSDDNLPYTEVLIGQDDPNRVFTRGMQAHGDDGPEGDPIVAPSDPSFARSTVSTGDGAGSSITYAVPFSPTEEWALTPARDVIFGVSATYRFELRHADGSISVIQRTDVASVPVQVAEADWNRRRVTATMRSMRPDWVWGDAPGIPSNKPAYDEFIPTHSGVLWVLRAGPGLRSPACDDQAEMSEQFAASPCWRDTQIVDVFGPDGRFLGSIEPPDEIRFSPRPYVDGDLVIAVAEDADGTIMVKRYRLALPS